VHVVFSVHLYIVISTSFPSTAFTSKGVSYANAWPAVHAIEVGFMTWHIEGDVEQLTRTLAMRKPRLEVCGGGAIGWSGAGSER